MKANEVLQILGITRATLCKYVKLNKIRKELEEIKDEK